MNLNRKIVGLFALLAFVIGLAPMAAAQYYDPSYGSRDDYRYNDDYYGNGRIRCESHDGRTRYCGVDARGGVRLVRQLSDRTCLRGRNWGVNERGLWVTDGCRAEFELGGYAGNGSGYGYGRSFRCESSDNRTRYCNADTRYGIGIVRQMSRDPCIEGRSWGVTRDGVWVSRGCRAEFAVGDRYQRDNTSSYRYRY